MPEKRPSRLAVALEVSLAAVGILFVVTAAEALLHVPLRQWGILPRTLRGLVGIVFSPLLHANFSHLAANTVPLFVLLLLLLGNREYRPVRTLAMIWLASGLGTWLIGRGQSVHIGASSLIFGLAAFLIVVGLQARSWQSALIAVLVFVAYGGIFYGALPQAGPISWEGHLSGAVAGVWAARQLKD
jgi:membrane associated rhomboid family serine protease